ncbi:glycosyltransferase family 2 protein [Tolypothrix sp. FACHB-123]|nr:glycosyltransferase family 2 protein [Tolypothrix sp. FACHB-123]
MNKKPLVSCIMIFLNAGEKFFIEAIESVFSQSYDNWELLLADDGSNDESTAIAWRYAQKYPDKVRYLEHEAHQNRGMSATRNLGIRHSQGEYIALLDADDIWLPQKLEKQLAILEAQPEAAMVYGSTLMWFSWTGNPEDTQRDFGRRLGVKPDTLVQPPKLLKLFLEDKASTPATCSVLMRRELVKNVGGFEESFRSMYEDQAFFYKVSLHAPVFIESSCWDRYRQHSNSSCYVAQALGQYNPSQPNSAHLSFLNWLKNYLYKKEVKDSEVWQALNKALWPYNYKKLYELSQFYQHIRQSVKKKIKQFIKLPLKMNSKLRESNF